MREILLLLVVALVAAAIVFGVAAIITGGDPGLQPAEPDDRFRTLPGDRPLNEEDITVVRFDTALRGYRMEQVDRAMSRIGYDLGYKAELIRALEAEVDALRAGRDEEADTLRDRRLAAAGLSTEPVLDDRRADLDEPTAAAPAPGDDLVDGTIELGDVSEDADDRAAEPVREATPAREAAPARAADADAGGDDGDDLAEPEEDADEAFAPRR
jgi:DivIVA domain-containing protein